MPRTIAFSLPCDTCQFDAHQLQPRVLAATIIRAWAHWLKDSWHLSFRELVEQHRASVVVIGYRLEYVAPFGFRDGDGLRVEASLKMRRDGKLMEQETLCRGPRGLIARLTSTHHGVLIGDPSSLAATPGPLPKEVLAHVQADEWVDSLPPPLSARALPTLEQEGRLLGERHTPFTVHRHLCEVADQWSFTEVTALASPGREGLGLDPGSSPELRRGLSQPRKSVEVELRRPFFAFDSGQAQTRAYALGQETAFVHRLQAGPELRGLIIERF